MAHPTFTNLDGRKWPTSDQICPLTSHKLIGTYRWTPHPEDPLLTQLAFLALSCSVVAVGVASKERHKFMLLSGASFLTRGQRLLFNRRTKEPPNNALLVDDQLFREC